MNRFYAVENTPLVYSKKQRQTAWEEFKRTRTVPTGLQNTCPAMMGELTRALRTGNKLQPAVLSECAYAQTLANMFGLTTFLNCADSPNGLDGRVNALLKAYNVTPRYAYMSPSGSECLIQAGGPNGADCFHVDLQANTVVVIEFKEPFAKTTEVDLPDAYGEDGFLAPSPKFLAKHTQFASMLYEQLRKRLNFWDKAGSNVNDFDPTYVQEAVCGTYASATSADVICVEDADGYLTVLPADQLTTWATVKGEIRPAGRNNYKVWTPRKLAEEIFSAGGRIVGSYVFIPLQKLTASVERGGTGTSRYKLTPIFFVRANKVTISGDEACFALKSVRQLRPTISAHLDFGALRINDVRSCYRTLLP